MSVLVAVQKDRRILTENRAHFFYLRRHFVFYLADKFFSLKNRQLQKTHKGTFEIPVFIGQKGKLFFLPDAVPLDKIKVDAKSCAEKPVGFLFYVGNGSV